MKRADPALPAILALAAVATTALAAEPECPVFLLRQTAEGVSMERSAIAPGETGVWVAGEESGVLDVILPVGPGGSGSDARAGAVHMVGCAEGAIERSVRHDGRETSFPARPIDELRRHDTRVSVTTGRGATAAFRIAGWSTVERDPGPVQNPFAGVPIPLGEHDALIFTDTVRRPEAASVRGVVALEVDRHLFARGKTAAGEGWLIVDTGAAQTVVSRTLIPASATIERTKTVEYSAAGRRLLDYAPGGATGTVEGVLGHATLQRLEVGELVFERANVAVMESLPDLFGRPIVGIVGLDLLRRGGALVLELPPGADGAGTLELRDELPEDRKNTSTVLSLVQAHLVLRSEIEGVDAFLILDTGAPSLVLDTAAAARAGVEAAASGRAGGLDGGSVPIAHGVVKRLRLGGGPGTDPERAGTTLTDVDARIAGLDVFASLRGPDQRIGLLGNTVLGRFSRVEVDLREPRIRFVP